MKAFNMETNIIHELESFRKTEKRGLINVMFFRNIFGEQWMVQHHHTLIL